MTRFLAVVSVLLRTALRGLQASVASSLATVLTIAVTLLVVGAFALLALNMRGLLDRVGDEIRVDVFLAGPIAEADAVSWVRRAEAIQGVGSVVFVSPEAALERFRRSVGGGALLEGVEGNPLPASLELSLSDGFRDRRSAARVAEVMAAHPGVDDVRYGDAWTQGYARALVVVRVVTWGFATVLGLAALLIVSNTIRLAIHAREDELEILALVGASRTFVWTPFLIEAGLQGLLAGCLAWLCLFAGFHLLAGSLEVEFAWLIGGVPPRFFGIPESAALLAGGGMLGLLGAVLALLGRRR